MGILEALKYKYVKTEMSIIHFKSNFTLILALTNSVLIYKLGLIVCVYLAI